MFLRTIAKRDSTLPTHRLRHSELSYETPFNEFSLNEIPDITTIKKAKKILLSKQQLLQNRINVIKKQQQKILKRKQNELKLFFKLEAVKQNHQCFTSPNKTPRKFSQRQKHLKTVESIPYGNPNPKRINVNALRTMNDETEERLTAEKLYLEKIENAKRLKLQKNHNQQKISKQRTLELNRKLQSAGMIRRNREKLKETRENFYRSRKQSVKNFKEEKIEQEKLKFIEIKENIKTLQKEEIEALQHWKKIMEDENFEFIGLRKLEINEAQAWME